MHLIFLFILIIIYYQIYHQTLVMNFFHNLVCLNLAFFTFLMMNRKLKYTSASNQSTTDG